ncbi:MAG: hypothetical protein KKC18_02440 [Chloroflexi bacterium]|nr:hypothetical protein [Chloroflexota bacterium]MBU1748895.1 hypothetical protein [Chloroflexota bacterium]
MKIPMKRITFLLILAALLLITGAVVAQTGGGYDLTWWTVDVGVGTVAGGGYTLTGTAGQPEPGPALSGDGFTLTSGFWPGGGGIASVAKIYLPLVQR